VLLPASSISVPRIPDVPRPSRPGGRRARRARTRRSCHLDQIMRFLEGSGDLAMIGTRGYLTISVGVTAASGCERRCSVAHQVRKSGLARIRHGPVRRSQPALCSIEPPGTGTMLHRAGGRVPSRTAGRPDRAACEPGVTAEADSIRDRPAEPTNKQCARPRVRQLASSSEESVAAVVTCWSIADRMVGAEERTKLYKVASVALIEFDHKCLLILGNLPTTTVPYHGLAMSTNLE
jgi:hypothetical protein